MHSHKLVREKDASKSEWLLEWDEVALRLKSPDGLTVFASESAKAHQLFEIYELYVERKISFDTPEGQLTFERQEAAVNEVRGLVEAGMRADVDYRGRLNRHARAAIVRGLAMFIIGGVPFGLYCWWASWAPDPPPGLRTRLVGGLIHLVLLGLLGLTLAGPYVAWFGVKQSRRIRRIEAELMRTP